MLDVTNFCSAITLVGNSNIQKTFSTSCQIMKVGLSFVPIDIIKWYFHIGIGKTLDSLGF